MAYMRIRTAKAQPEASTFVVGGLGRLIDAVEAEVRATMEAKYADAWNTSGLMKRWFMRRKIEREIAEAVTEQLKHVSRDSLF